MFSSCNQNLKDSFSILQGNFYWHQKKYQQAEMEFLQTLNSSEESGNKEIQQYAIYGLGSSYVMQNEEVAALNRLESIKTLEIKRAYNYKRKSVYVHLMISYQNPQISRSNQLCVSMGFTSQRVHLFAGFIRELM